MKIPDPAAVKQNALVLSNASALTNALITEIGEQSIAKTMNGESLTRDRIEQMVAMKLSSCIQANI